MAGKRMLQKYLETEDVNYLSEAHKYYQQCETGRYKKKDISHRFGLYIAIGDYEGGRRYLSKLKDADYPESLNPSLLRMQFDIYELYEKMAYAKVDSMMHLFLNKHAQLYKQTEKTYWLQEMIAWHQECCEENQQLNHEDIHHAFSAPEKFDLDSFLLLIDRSSYSMGESYYEMIKVRNCLHNKKGQ